MSSTLTDVRNFDYLIFVTMFCFILLQPKLTMAKCRKNVENFLDACRKIGVGKVK